MFDYSNSNITRNILMWQWMVSDPAPIVQKHFLHSKNQEALG